MFIYLLFIDINFSRHDLRSCLHLFLHQLLHGIEFEPVVGIDMGKEGAGGGSHSRVAGGGKSPVVFMPDDSCLRLALRIIVQHAPEDLDALVGRAVVDKDDVEVLVRLVKDGAGTPLNIFLNSIDGNEN